MSDIFGRSTSRPADVITRRHIASMIKRYVTSGLNLVDVDSGEIVVFENEQGKLKTSNLSLDDLLTKQPNADDDSIVLFKKGKLEPSYKITTITDKFNTIQNNETLVKAVVDCLTQLRAEYYSHVTNISTQITAAIDNLAKLRTEYDTHVTNFLTLRKKFNITDTAIEKFFGKKNIKPDEIKTVLADINTAQQKSTNDIADINSRLGVIRDTKSISDLIAINKKSIDDIKTITDAVSADSSKLDKLKIPHKAIDIKNLSYVVYQELDKEYLAKDDKNILEKVLETTWYEAITGIYRISIISEHQFNIEVSVNDKKNVIATSKGINTVLIALRDKPVLSLIEKVFGNFKLRAKPVDETVVRAKYSYIVEYVSAID